jgi:hypothetical protein
VTPPGHPITASRAAGRRDRDLLLAASFLGVFLFGERVRTGLPALAGEALALALLIAGVSALSHSHLATREGASPSPGFRDYPPTGPR